MPQSVSCQNALPPDNLVDIRTVTVDKTLPQTKRLADFIRQIGNPYRFRCGDMIVNIRFTENGPTMEECLQGILR